MMSIDVELQIAVAADAAYPTIFFKKYIIEGPCHGYRLSCLHDFKNHASNWDRPSQHYVSRYILFLIVLDITPQLPGYNLAADCGGGGSSSSLREGWGGGAGLQLIRQFSMTRRDQAARDIASTRPPAAVLVARKQRKQRHQPHQPQNWQHQQH